MKGLAYCLIVSKVFCTKYALILGNLSWHMSEEMRALETGKPRGSSPSEIILGLRLEHQAARETYEAVKATPTVEPMYLAYRHSVASLQYRIPDSLSARDRKTALKQYSSSGEKHFWANFWASAWLSCSKFAISVLPSFPVAVESRA